MHSIKTSFKNGIASLSLTQCSPGDAGIYTCTAENTTGRQSSSAALHITGKVGVSALETLMKNQAHYNPPLNELYWTDLFTINLFHSFVLNETATKEIPRKNQQELLSEVTQKSVPPEKKKLSSAFKVERQHRTAKDKGGLTRLLLIFLLNDLYMFTHP